jgi:hypothetical protein
MQFPVYEICYGSSMMFCLALTSIYEMWNSILLSSFNYLCFTESTSYFTLKKFEELLKYEMVLAFG